MWDALAGVDPRAGFMQASFWADFKRAEGYTVRRYGWWEGEALSGGATVYEFASASGQPGIAVCPEGPILDWDDAAGSRARLRSLIEAVRADFPRALSFRIEPHLSPTPPSILRNFQRAPFDLTPVHTLVLDLTQSEDALFASMRPKGRYNCRVAERHDVRVASSASLADMAVFYRLFSATARRQQFFAEPYRFFLNLGAALFPGRHAEVFLAEWQRTVLAAALVVFHGHRATFLYGGSSHENRHVMPAYALHREIMNYARRRGCTEYDLYGFDPFGNPEHEYAGFSRFKRQLGGTVRSTLGARDLLWYDRIAEQLLPQLRATV